MSKDEKTTTTTTQKPDQNDSVTDTTTVTEQSGRTNQVEKRGEVHIDENAESHKLKEQSSDERLADARAEGLRNHEVEHANDADTNVGDPTSRDKE